MQTLKRKYRDNMLNRTNAMFTWEGLPDTIPAWILELYLQTNGNIESINELKNAIALLTSEVEHHDNNEVKNNADP